jgi:hypothetical protein
MKRKSRPARPFLLHEHSAGSAGAASFDAAIAWASRATLDRSSVAEDSPAAAGVEFQGPVAVVALGDRRDSLRAARLIAPREDVAAVVIDARALPRGGSEGLAHLLGAVTLFRSLGLECVLAGALASGARARVPRLRDLMARRSIAEAVWAALRLVSHQAEAFRAG